jgi:hypothetical protein
LDVRPGFVSAIVPPSDDKCHLIIIWVTHGRKAIGRVPRETDALLEMVIIAPVMTELACGIPYHNLEISLVTVTTLYQSRTRGYVLTEAAREVPRETDALLEMVIIAPVMTELA